MNITPQKYHWIELTFGQYRIIRKLFGGFWVKLKEPGYSWVKFDKDEFESLRIPGTKFLIEDYTTKTRGK